MKSGLSERLVGMECGQIRRIAAMLLLGPALDASYQDCVLARLRPGARLTGFYIPSDGELGLSCGSARAGRPARGRAAGPAAAPTTA